MFVDSSSNTAPVLTTIVRMKFFKEIQKNSLIKFHIVNVLNPSGGNGTIVVLLKNKTNRREKIISIST